MKNPTYVKGYAVMAKDVGDLGKETIKRVSRVYHVKDAANQFANLARHLHAECYVTEIIGKKKMGDIA